MNRAAFLDRDGVINRKARKGEYITRWEEMEFLPGVAEAIALLNSSDFRVIVITNQRCVAKGQISIPELESLHHRMVSELAKQGARIDAVYYCPHEKEPRCDCRKPAPGMLKDAARDHDIDLGQSWMIGDSDIDIEAGKAAGCKTVRIVAVGEKNAINSDLSAESLLAAVHSVQEHGYITARR
jgi:D-glycero-D-manno-heptose 1,7-bisphosphate phosphatase